MIKKLYTKKEIFLLLIFVLLIFCYLFSKKETQCLTTSQVLAVSVEILEGLIKGASAPAFRASFISFSPSEEKIILFNI